MENENDILNEGTVDNTEQTETTETTESTTQVKTSKKTRRIPLNAANLLALAIVVQESWSSRSNITLAWKTQEEFAANVADLKIKVNEKSTTKGRRSPISKQLRELDVIIDSNLRYLKNSLENLYGHKIAISHYPSFGIDHTKNGYKLPRDRQSRIQSLDLMVASIAEYNINDDLHGLDFWTNIRDNYKDLMSQTTENVRGVSVLKGVNDQLIIEIRKVMKNLILVIKANYPDSSDNELRNWGFLRELF